MTLDTVIVKVGGSLFDLPDLPDRIHDTLPTDLRCCLLCGGGRLADAVRELDAAHQLPPATSHQLALQSMDIHARLLCEILPNAVLSATPNDLEAAFRDEFWPVLEPSRVIEHIAATTSGSPLPYDWNVTSDSIAAWIANRWQLPELYLLKSCDPPDGTIEQAVAAGFVDGRLPQIAAAGLTIRWFNVRASTSGQLR